MGLKSSIVGVNINRILKTLFAHGFGVAVSVLAIISIPWICLSHWTAEQFGIWIFASSVSYFFAQSDGGISSAVNNHLCLMKNMDSDVAADIYKDALKHICKRIAILCSVLLLVVILVFFLKNAYKVINTSAIAINVMSALIVASACQPLIGLGMAVFRYVGRNEFGILIGNFIRLLEIVILSLVVALNGDILLAAVMIMALKIICSFIFMKLVERKFIRKMVGESRVGPSINGLKDLHKAGHGFLLNAVAINIALHASTVVAAQISAASSAIFSSVRTLTRLSAFPLTIVFMSLAPEFTELYKRGDYKKFKLLSFIVISVSIMVVGSVGVLTIIYKTWFEANWLHGKVALPTELLVIMVTGATINIGWQAISQILASINETYKIGVSYIILCLVAVVISALFINGYGLVGIGGSFVVVDFIMSGIVIRRMIEVMGGMRNNEC